MWDELKKIRYAVEVDEEGFAMFDGMRVDDSGLNHTLFQNLKHFDVSNFKSPLVTTCEGELCFWQAFDAPLVAQSVDYCNQSSSQWNFLGGLHHSVLHQDIEVDNWQRLHAWVGPEKIPAVLSRKAQAAFLQSAPVETLKPKKFRAAADPVHEEEFWTNVYANKEDGWELNAPTPLLSAESEKIFNALPTRAKILVPGCGRGHDAEFLSQRAYYVTGLDFSPHAIADAKNKYPMSKAMWTQADAFAFLKTHPKEFDGIFEHTFFCAINPDQRLPYLKLAHSALKKGAFLFGVFFPKAHAGGPPFGLTQWELREMCKGLFHIKEWRISKHSLTPRLSQELWVVLEAL